jgi:hypothetical protein
MHVYSPLAEITSRIIIADYPRGIQVANINDLIFPLYKLAWGHPAYIRNTSGAL